MVTNADPQPSWGKTAPLVKICGVREPDDARAAASLGADFIGIVFAPSRRQVTMGQAQKIAAALRKEGLSEGRSPDADAATIERALQESRPLLVGVFADQDAETVNRIARECKLDIVQLAGSEPWEMCSQIERPVFKCLKVQEDYTAAEVRERIGEGVVPLLDPFVSGVYGGTGQRIDWNIAADVAQSVALVLAGGLSPENVADAVATVRPWAVDVSSGVETEGKKDVAKIRAFILAAKSPRSEKAPV